MRLSALGAGVLLSFVIFSVEAPKASAQMVAALPLRQNGATSDRLEVLAMVEDQSVVQAQPEAPVAPPQPIRHVVIKGDTLSSIASHYQTTWVRLYAKNIQLEHPDVITHGLELTVPTNDEQLAERALPAPVPEPVVEKPIVKQPVKKPAQSQPRQRTQPRAPRAQTVRGSSAGNTYGYGYCTWYAKNRRMDLPNSLGNADTWVSRAAAQGLATGSQPRAGAVGQRGMHVVYVESVNGDGTITISEMNREGWNVVSSRTVPASYFTYIY